MKDFWDLRYRNKEYAYGEMPNEYLKAILPKLPVGKILFPAEGEGRNAVFAAKLNWDVSAFDSSGAGKKKANFLASKNGVKIDYVVKELAKTTYPEHYFDAIAFLFAHFPAEKRREYHRKLSSALKKGGTLILEGFTKNHIKSQQENPQVGGPKDISMLYDLKGLKKDFENFEFIDAYETETELNEGFFHVGKASVLRILAIKK